MASSEQVGTKEGDEVGESPSPGLLSLASLLEHSLAILQGLQKPRSILKRGFSVNKAMKSNQVFIECKVSSPARDQLQTKEGGWTQGHPPNTRSLPASCISFRVEGGKVNSRAKEGNPHGLAEVPLWAEESWAHSLLHPLSL